MILYIAIQNNIIYNYYNITCMKIIVRAASKMFYKKGILTKPITYAIWSCLCVNNDSTEFT